MAGTVVIVTVLVLALVVGLGLLIFRLQRRAQDVVPRVADGDGAKRGTASSRWRRTGAPSPRPTTCRTSRAATRRGSSASSPRSPTRSIRRASEGERR